MANEAPAPEAPPTPVETPATPTPADGTAPPTPEAPAAPPAQEVEAARTLALKLAQEKAANRRLRSEYEAANLTARQFAELRQVAATNPGKLLEAFGVNFDSVLDHYARNGEPKAPTADDKLAAIEAKLAKQEADATTAREQAKQAQMQAEVEQGKAIARQALTEKADTYPAILATGRHEEVWDALRSYAQQHSIREVTIDHLHAVAAAYETVLQNALDEEYGNLIQKVPKLAARRASTATDANGQSATTDGTGAKGQSAVNMTARSTSEAPPPTSGKRLSREESIKLAIEKAKAEGARNAA